MNKIFISILAVASVSATVLNMNASPNYEFKDEQRIQDLSFIEKNVPLNEIKATSFMNNNVDIQSCIQVFKENNIRHYQYDDCLEFTDVLKVYNKAEKQANNHSQAKKDFTI